MSKKTIRIVTKSPNGEILIRDLPHGSEMLKMHKQIGVDDCSTHLDLRGLPVFRDLVGPMPDGKSVARYESPEVFEELTKQWSTAKPTRRRRK